METVLHYIIKHLSSLSILFPLIVGLIYARRITYPWKIFLYLIFIAGFTEAVLLSLSTFRIHNLWVMNLYMPVEFVLINLFYRQVLVNKTIRKIIYPLNILFVLLISASYLYYDISKLNNTMISFAYFLTTITSGIVLTECVSKSQGSLFNNPTFIIALGFFIYSSFAVVIFGFFRKLSYIDDFKTFIYYFNITHTGINTVCNIIYAYALYLCRTLVTKSYSASY